MLTSDSHLPLTGEVHFVADEEDGPVQPEVHSQVTDHVQRGPVRLLVSYGEHHHEGVGS